MKRLLLLVALLIIVPVSAGGSWIDTAPGGTASQANDTDMLPISQAGIGRVISRATLMTGYLPSATAALTYQPLDTDLNTWAGISPSANVTSLLSAADYAAIRAQLSLGSAALTNATSYATAAQGIAADTAYSWGNHAGLYSLLGHDHAGIYLEVGAIAGHTSGVQHGTTTQEQSDIAEANAHRTAPHAPANAISPPPSDGKPYIYQDGNWVEYTLAMRVAEELANDPYHLEWYYGPPETPGTCADETTTPSAQALASKNAKLAIGWPEANLSWMCREAVAFQFTLLESYSLTFSDSGGMQMTAGQFQIAESYSLSYSDDGSMSEEGGNNFTLQESYSLTYSDSGDMTMTAGEFFIQESYSLTSSDSGGMSVEGGGGTEITVYADINVGINDSVYNEGIDGAWATVRSAASGVGLNGVVSISAEYLGDYGDLYTVVNRGFVRFDLTAIPTGAQIISAILRVKTGGNPSEANNPKLSVMQGTQPQASQMTTADFDSFTGTEFGLSATITDPDTVYDITLNAAGLDYLEGFVDSGKATLCLREHDHDYLNSSPAAGVRHYATFRGTGAGTDNMRLIITYTE